MANGNGGGGNGGGGNGGNGGNGPSGQSNGNGNGNGNGGPQGGGGGGGQDRRERRRRRRQQQNPLLGLPPEMLAALRGAARLAFSGQMSDVNREIRSEKARGKSIDRAYDAYATQLGEVQLAQQQNTQSVMGNLTNAGTALQGIGAAQTAQSAADAQARAQALGQTDGTAQAFQNLGAGAAASRGDAIGASLGGVANVGVASSADLGRRGLTGARDRIRAQDDRRDKIGELKRERREIKGEKGAFKAQQLYEMLQQAEENQLAWAGLQLDRRGQNLDADQAAADQALAEAAFDLDAYDTRFDNRLDQQQAQDDRAEDREDRGQGSGQNGGQGQGPNSSEGRGQLGGLSPSERAEWHDYRDQVKSAQGLINKIMREQGVGLAEARRKAQNQGGYSEWVYRVASSLVNSGQLNSNARSLWYGHTPGSAVPGDWR